MIVEFNFGDEKLTRLWNDYEMKRESGLKKNANKTLSEFIERLRLFDDNLIERFVEHLMKVNFDDRIGSELQYPLLKIIIFPVLLRGYKDRRMPHVRWLYQLPYIDQECAMELDGVVNVENVREELLLQALYIDRDDAISQHLLLKYYIKCLEYGMHEIPSGLLFPIDQGFEMIRKAYNLLDTYNFDQVNNAELKMIIVALNYCNELLLAWKDYKSQNSIKSFNIWCEFNNVDYLGFRAEIWKVAALHF